MNSQRLFCGEKNWLSGIQKKILTNFQSLKYALINPKILYAVYLSLPNYSWRGKSGGVTGESDTKNIIIRVI